VKDLGHVLAMFIDIVFVFDELIAHDLFEIVAFGSDMRHSVDDVQYEVETIDLILYAHIEGRGNGAFFLVAANVHVVVGAAVGQAVDQPGIAVESEDDMFVFGEQGVEVIITEPMRVFGTGLELHEVHDVDNPDLQIGQVFLEDGHGGKDFKRGRIPAAGHDDIGPGLLVVAGPLPDADAFGAMYDRLFHAEPLG